jgi:hypothetical protein
MDGFTLLQIAVAVLLGNVMTRCLFRGWDRVKQERLDFWTAAFYVGPLAMIVLVLIGSTGPQ